MLMISLFFLQCFVRTEHGDISNITTLNKIKVTTETGSVLTHSDKQRDQQRLKSHHSHRVCVFFCLCRDVSVFPGVAVTL